MVKGLTKDTDKDGVADFFDCKPNNPNEQGLLHNLKERYNEHAEVSRQKRAAERQIRKKSRAAYYRESEKAEIEAAERSARTRSRDDRSRSTTKTVKKGLDILAAKRKTSTKKSSHGKKKSKKKPEYVVVGGKAYTLGAQAAKKKSTKKKTSKKQSTKKKSPWDMTLEEMF